MSKLRFVPVIATLFIVGAVAQSQPVPAGLRPGRHRVVKVKDYLDILQNNNSNMVSCLHMRNATFYLTDAGVILVDSKSDAEHDDFLAKLKTLTDKPIKYVILTHNHGDHSGGVAKLQAMGATLLIGRRPRKYGSRKPARCSDVGDPDTQRLVMEEKKSS